VGHTFGYHATAPGTSATPWTVGLTEQGALLDVASGRRGLRRDVARAALQAARASRDDALRTLALAVRTAYAEMAFSDLAVDLSRRIAETTAATAELVATRYRAGAVSEADVARAETDRLEAEQALDAALQDRSESAAGLAFLLGVRSATPEFEIDRDVLTYREVADLQGRSRDDLLADALATRPDLRAAAAQRDRAQASVVLARRQLVPDVAWNVSYSQEGTGDDAIQPPTLTFGVTVPIPAFYQYRGEIEKAHADVRTQDVTYDRTIGQVASELSAAHAAYLATRSRAMRMEGRQLASAERARDLVEVQYRKGAASLLELLDAQRTYIAVANERLRTLADYWEAVFRVEAAVGREVEP
jgi:cobalt-zinc-cadmium efflux system outer membrane protein